MKYWTIFLILTVFFLSVIAHTAEAYSYTWADGSSTKRNCFNVSSATTLSNYQYFKNITYDSDMQSDFSDIRLYRQNATYTSELPYWIEDKSDGIYAVIWFKADLIDASEDICVYYGSSQTSESNGTATFDCFDDFDDGDYATSPAWTIINQGSANTPVISGGRLKMNGTSSNMIMYMGGCQISSPATMSALLNTGGVGDWEGVELAMINDTGASPNHYEGGLIPYTDKSVLAIYSGSWDTTFDTSTAINTSTDYYTTFRFNSTGAELYWDTTLPVSTLRYRKVAAGYANYAKGYPSIRIGLGSTILNIYVDNFIVRAFSQTEPTTGVMQGEETETVNTPPAITIVNPENVTYYSVNVPLNFTATDSNSSSIIINLYIDGSLNDTFNITNATYEARTLYLTGGAHGINITASDGNASSEDQEYFYVWSGFNVSLADNDTGTALTSWTVCFENVTSSNCTSGNNNPFMVEWNTIPAGTINITFDDGSSTLYYFNNTYSRTNDNANYENLSAVLEEKPASTITLTSSPSWSIGLNTEVTVTCTSSEGSPSLYRDGVGISNPYTATLPADLYNFTCTIGETDNYAPARSTSWLNVLSGGFGCTDNMTYAFYKNISTPGNNITLNFTDLVINHFVKSDLSDVYLNTSNATSTVNGSYFMVNTENVSSIRVLFGNYFANISHSNAALVNYSVDSMAAYSENGPYYFLTFIEETTGAEQIPPNATCTLVLYCSEGTTWKQFNASKIMVASKSQLDSMKALVEYSLTEIYYRSLIADSEVEYKNFYLVDANEHQVAQMVISIQDSTGDFVTGDLVIKKYMDGDLETITEQSFDAEGKAVIYLINGDKYQIYVEAGANVRNIGYLFVDSVDLTKTITISDALTSDMAAANISYYLNRTGDTIVFTFHDAAELTHSSEFWVYNWTNRNGTLLYYANSSNASTASYAYVVPETNGTYKVIAKIHHYEFGLNSITLTQIFEVMGAFAPPFLFWGLTYLFGATLPGGLAPQAFVSMIALLFFAMLFPPKHAATMGILAVLAAATMSYFLWWPIGVGVLVTAMFLAFVNKLIKSERGRG